MPVVRADPIRWYHEPRSDGPPRRMAVLSEPDGAAWSAVGRAVAAVLERRLRPGVLGNRAEAGGWGWALRPLDHALRTARTGVAGLRRDRLALLATDVRAFYPSVRPEVAHRALRRAGVGRADARLAAELMERWGNEGYAGLPIGPPASAVVANAVLAPVDDALGPLTFLRWVDDYLIGLRSEREAALALERLDEGLDRVGLVRSGRKTRYLGRGSGWLGAARGLSDLRGGRA